MVTRYAPALLMALALSNGCGAKKKASQAIGGTTKPVATVTLDSLAPLKLQGSLTLTGSGAAAAGLTEGIHFENSLDATSSYSIYGITFEATPKTCVANIDASGAFSQECPGFPGKASGFFIRQGNRTVGDLVFDTGTSSTDTSLVAGSGPIVFNVILDTDTKQAVAKVDMAKSAALAPEAVAKAKEVAKAKPTAFGKSISGNWELTISESTSKEESGDGPGNGTMDIHLNAFTGSDGKPKTAIWESAATRSRCVGTGDENTLKPKLVVGNETIEFNAQDQDAYEATMKSVLLALPPALRTAFLQEAAKNPEETRCIQYREQRAQAMARFNNDTCKFVVRSKVPVQNFVDGRLVSFMAPKFYSNIAEAEAEELPSTTTVTSVEVPCVQPRDFKPDPNNPGKPVVFCSNPNSSTETQYRVGQDPVELVCLDPFSKDQNLTPTAGQMQQLWYNSARGATKSAAIAAMVGNTSGGNMQDKTCQEAPDSVFLVGSTKLSNMSVKRVYNALSNVFSDGEEFHDLERYCGRWEVPSNFTFNSCPSDDSVEDKPQVCWSASHIRNSFKLEIDGAGKLVKMSSFDVNAVPDHMIQDPSMGKILCPTAYTTHINIDLFHFSTSSNDRELKKNACVNEFVGLTAVEQGRRVNRINSRPLEVSLMCSEGNTALNTLIPIIQNVSQNSCMPRVRLDWFCDATGNCAEKVRCDGSKAEGGDCYVNGKFAGRVNGLFAVMDLNMLFNDAFTMSELGTDTFYQYKDGKSIKCKMSHVTTIKAMRKTDDAFSGNFSSTDSRFCDGDSADSAGRVESFKADFVRK